MKKEMNLFIAKHINKCKNNPSILRNPSISITLAINYYSKVFSKEQFDRELSKNLSLTIEHIEHIGMDWNFGKDGLSSHPCVTEEFIEKYATKQWDWAELSKKIDLSLKFIEKYRLLLDFWELSDNENITIAFVNKYHYMRWNYAALGKRFMKDMMTVHLRVGCKFDINNARFKMTRKCLDSSIILEFIFQNFMYIDWMALSENRFITIEIIESCIEFAKIHKIESNWCWGYGGLSLNPHIAQYDFLVKHQDKWNYGFNGLSSNFLVPFKFIKERPFRMWHYGCGGLSENPSIPLEFVEANINKEWDFSKIGPSCYVKYNGKHILEQELQKYELSEFCLIDSILSFLP